MPFMNLEMVWTFFGLPCGWLLESMQFCAHWLCTLCTVKGWFTWPAARPDLLPLGIVQLVIHFWNVSSHSKQVWGGPFFSVFLGDNVVMLATSRNETPTHTGPFTAQHKVAKMRNTVFTKMRIIFEALVIRQKKKSMIQETIKVMLIKQGA